MAEIKNLKDNIHQILHGSGNEKEMLKGHFFYLADTPKYMKDIGLTGDYFSVRYGVIIRHKDKDEDHNISEQNWIDICDAIIKPFAITKFSEGFRIYTTIKSGKKMIVVGVNVKSIKKGIEINSVSTIFKRNENGYKNEVIIYKK